jgi:hypothetical protein
MTWYGHIIYKADIYSKWKLQKACWDLANNGGKCMAKTWQIKGNEGIAIFCNQRGKPDC